MGETCIETNVNMGKIQWVVDIRELLGTHLFVRDTKQAFLFLE